MYSYGMIDELVDYWEARQKRLRPNEKFRRIDQVEKSVEIYNAEK